MNERAAGIRKRKSKEKTDTSEAQVKKEATEESLKKKLGKTVKMMARKRPKR